MLFFLLSRVDQETVDYQYGIGRNKQLSAFLFKPKETGIQKANKNQERIQNFSWEEMPTLHNYCI